MNKKVDDFLSTTQKRNNLLVGSAGSGKSWGIGQHLLFDKAMVMPRVRFLITRTTGPALKKSCWLLMNDLIATYQIKAKPNKSDLSLTLFNGAQMFFVPLDDVAKFKSMEKINYVWAEEATQLAHDEYKQLGLRCRGDNPYGMNQLYFSFNPDDENSFLKPLTENPPDDTAVNHSTYLDNAFLAPEYIREIEKLKEIDLVYWLIYGKGVWATPSGMIYSNWDIIKHWPDSFDETIYGVDFGFNNPSVVLEIGIKDMEFYIRELIYESSLTNSDLIGRMESTGMVERAFVYADSSEPDRIEEIARAGFNIFPCRKGKNSVIDGIDVVKRYRVHVHEDSVNTIKEKRAYKWRQDKNGNSLDEPVKFNDHSMDAERYAIATHLASYGNVARAISSIKTYAELGIE